MLLVATCWQAHGPAWRHRPLSGGADKVAVCLQLS